MDPKKPPVLGGFGVAQICVGSIRQGGTADPEPRVAAGTGGRVGTRGSLTARPSELCHSQRQGLPPRGQPGLASHTEDLLWNCSGFFFLQESSESPVGVRGPPCHVDMMAAELVSPGDTPPVAPSVDDRGRSPAGRGGPRGLVGAVMLGCEGWRDPAPRPGLLSPKAALQTSADVPTLTGITFHTLRLWCIHMLEASSRFQKACSRQQYSSGAAAWFWSHTAGV